MQTLIIGVYGSGETEKETTESRNIFIRIITNKIFIGLVWTICLTAIIALTAARLSEFEIIGPTVPFAYPWRL